MTAKAKYLLPLLCLFFVLASQADLYAQQADSTERTFFVNPRPEPFTVKPHSERSMQSFAFPQSGIFSVPGETQYYQLPFKGQYYLNLAVETYRKEQREQIGAGWLNQFMRAIAPFVNMKFGFSVYNAYDLPVVARDNPLFQSHGRNNIGEENEEKEGNR